MEPSEIKRYEEYDARHGAHYAQHDADAVTMEEDEW